MHSNDDTEARLDRVREFLTAPIIGLVIWVVIVITIRTYVDWRPARESSSGYLQGVCGLGAVLVGFSVTALSILFSLPNTPVVTYVRQRGGIKQLVRLLFHDTLVWLLSTVGALVLLLLQPASDSSPDLVDAYRQAMCIWSALPICGFCMSTRTLRFFVLLAIQSSNAIE